MRSPMLIAFDFDGTITDRDTLAAILEVDGGEKSVAQFYSTLKAADELSAKMEGKIRDLQISKNISEEDIRKITLSVPMSEEMDRVLHLLKSHECDVIIISDGMTNLINDWLVHHSVSSLVNNVYANPSYFDSEGYIVIEPYHIQKQCDKSFRSMCKGRVLEEYVNIKKAEGVTFDRLAYFGDGKNDLCPMLRLGMEDLAFPREGSTLLHMLNSTEQGQVKATIHPWHSGRDIVETLVKYLHPSK